MKVKSDKNTSSTVSCSVKNMVFAIIVLVTSKWRYWDEFEELQHEINLVEYGDIMAHHMIKLHPFSINEFNIEISNLNYPVWVMATADAHLTEGHSCTIALNSV